MSQLIKIEVNQSNEQVVSAKYSEKGYVSIKQDILDNGRIIYDRKRTEAWRRFLLDKFSKKEAS